MTTPVLDFVYGNIRVAEIPNHPEERKLFDENGNSFIVAVGDKVMLCSKSNSLKRLTAGFVTGFDGCGDPNRIETDGNLSNSIRKCGYIAKLPHK